MKNVKTDPTKNLLTISVGFTLIYLVSGWHWALLVSLVVGLIGVFSESLSKIVSDLWMKLAWVLSLIVPNILLSLIFFLFLFPISVLSNFFRKEDPLRLKNKSDSAFKERNTLFDKQSFEKPW